MGEVRSLNGLTGDLSVISGKGIEIQVGQPDITVSNKGVLTLNDLSGQVNIVVGKGLSLSESPPDLTLHNTGVLSLQGRTGQIELTTGTGIGISGLTISNTGVTEILAGDGIKLSANKGRITITAIPKQDSSISQRLDALEKTVQSIKQQPLQLPDLSIYKVDLTPIEKRITDIEQTFNKVLEELQKASPAKKKSIVEMLQTK